MGRPANPVELAVKCDLFPASPEFVEFLCFVPGSPLLLTENGLATLSPDVFVAFGEFAARCVPTVGIGICGVWKLCGNVKKSYFRKRRRDINEVLPLVNKRLVSWLVNGNEEEETQFCSRATADKTSVNSKIFSSKVKNVNMNVVPCLESPSMQLQHEKTDLVLKAQQAFQINIKNTTISMKHKSKHSSKDNIIIQETDCKDLTKIKAYPKFQSFLVEEEEGSGGYGTVYRARRKSDGTTFAIKYPHANAHKHHVNNELKMLERFGGCNFVIKYEGSVKSGNSDCFVLQYVEHDRPEVLKREIDVFQLQWYGYCMFKALAGLHKRAESTSFHFTVQGVVHRDVKPGNFLFSCRNCKGFLIDFNLAKDLHQKYGDFDRMKAFHSTSFEHVSTTNLKHRNSLGSQGADGSGLTTSKDVTSARISSVERLREPLPCIGRKELINMAQTAIESSNHEAPILPSSKRKRIAAPPRNMNKRVIYLTPMPLHSSGIAVCGASLLKRGEGKPQKEGACVGTKGFRAPEVLLRSAHQGPKVDVWSAGVTLLYLVTGRLPFNGDPEQNMKEIVKLRGSEDLWEVAKLHNRECSFPMELFDVKFLPSLKLLEWCKANTKRPDFLETAPSSVFDLIDKCLTVNPRLRISAEEALQHEFFQCCHEDLQKKRLLRQSTKLEPKSSSSSRERGLTRSIGVPC
ncbi:hypothetical protein Dimus_035251 [Dionaea muscipula]